MKRSQTQIGQVAGEHAEVPQEETVVALSSAEAELCGFVRASAGTLGLTSMYKDFGPHRNGVVLGDASAALAIGVRRGLGKLRHLDSNY